MAPTSSQELAELVAELHKENKPWHPCGMNTRMNWGPPINGDSQAISSRGIHQIIHHAIDDLTITVEAGLSLTELQKTLSEKGQWLAVDWPWGSSPILKPKSTGTIGGLIARGLSGSLRQKHLGVRDQLIGIGLIRSDGLEAHAGGQVVKNVAGYDLMRLLCGSWGSLAFITQLTLRTEPIKSAHSYLTINGKLQNIESFRSELLNSSFTPEYIDWKKETIKIWHLQLGLASVTNKALEDQIEGIQRLANKHELKTQHQEWDGPPNLDNTSENLSTRKINFLLRINMPPSMIIELINSEELNSLSCWEWRFGAGTGLGEGWEVNSQTSNYLKSTNDISRLRNKITKLGGQVVILIQPFNTINRISAWSNSPSAALIKAIKKQFDPKNQIAIGRLPGVSS